jgi:hypothetical protein
MVDYLTSPVGDAEPLTAQVESASEAPEKEPSGRAFGLIVKAEKRIC